MSAAAAEEDLSETEREGLELVRETGGIYQSNFWKELDISSRKGSRVVESLLEAGLVQREDAVYKGNTTYYITPAARDLDFSLLMAGDMLAPFVGDDEADPQSDGFSQWVMNLAYEERQ
jgi:DNA-binding MarR family transcriptional regulator